jgi:hypothetical protein
MQQDWIKREERSVALLTWHEQVPVLRYTPVPDSVPGAEEAEWVREARVSDITARRCEPVDDEGAREDERAPSGPPRDDLPALGEPIRRTCEARASDNVAADDVRQIGHGA